MVRIKLGLLYVIAVVIVISCAAGPQPVSEARPEPAPVQETQQPAEVVIAREEPRIVTVPDPVPVQEIPAPVVVTEELYVSTRTEVQLFIQRLNQIIRIGDYEGWRAALSPELFAEISSPENLRQISEQPIMRNRRIVLRTAEDYFTHVVRPARANITDVVDDIDIEFVTLTRVKAFTVTTSRSGDVQQVILYDLEKIGNTWTIVN